MELLRPFANTGDKEDFDENTAPDGSMSLEKGFTTLFELKPEEGGLFILRRKFNQLMYLMSKANVEFNTQSFPSWIADAGSGTPYAYNTYAIVRYTDGNNYVSLVDNNTEEPTIGSDWTEFTDYLQSFGAEIATAEEIRTGTNNTKAITPLGYNQTTLGWGQTWQDVSASRAVGVTYTNTTGRPIYVFASFGLATLQTNQLEVDGLIVGEFVAAGTAVRQGVVAIVPNGSTYKAIAFQGGTTIEKWAELR